MDKRTVLLCIALLFSMSRRIAGDGRKTLISGPALMPASSIESGTERLSSSLCHFASGNLIGPGSEISSKQGKNIHASMSGDGDTLAVCWGYPSGHPYDFWLLWAAYSFDGGSTWVSASSTLSPRASPYLNPGVICPAESFLPHFVWQQADSVSSPLYFTYDEFFPFMLFTPQAIAGGHWWFPSIVITSRGDTIRISAADKFHAEATNNAYLFRWPASPVLMIDTQGNPYYEDLDPPRMVLGSAGYIFGLFNWIPTSSDMAIPHYTESTDYGATWRAPDTLFPAWPPYPDATCDWNDFDCILVNDRPHCSVKLSMTNQDYGDIWEVHPTAGGPGDWTNWTATCLIGDGQGDSCATMPSIGRDAQGDLHVIYHSWFLSSQDTTPDIGYLYSTDGGTSWSDPVNISNDPLFEMPFELADNVSNYLHIIYECADSERADSVWHLRYRNPTVGTEEFSNDQLPMTNYQLLSAYPNPFHRTTVIRYAIPDMGYGMEENPSHIADPVEGRGPNGTSRPTSHITLAVYDLAGRLVKTLIDEQSNHSTMQPYNQVTWDGKDDSGTEVPAGVYFYSLTARRKDGGQAEEFKATRKAVILR